MSWHRFTRTSDDDNECNNPDCAVVVSDEAMKTYSTTCPAPACTDSSNDGGCVMVPGEDGPICSYCDRIGGAADVAQGADDQFDDEIEALLAALDVDVPDEDGDLAIGTFR